MILSLFWSGAQMIVGTKERIYWIKRIYPEQLQTYLDMGWEHCTENRPDKRHPFIDGCAVRWNGEQMGPVLDD